MRCFDILLLRLEVVQLSEANAGRVVSARKWTSSVQPFFLLTERSDLLTVYCCNMLQVLGYFFAAIGTTIISS
jgi:hypothetical protein